MRGEGIGVEEKDFEHAERMLQMKVWGWTLADADYEFVENGLKRKVRDSKKAKRAAE